MEPPVFKVSLSVVSQNCCKTQVVKFEVAILGLALKNRNQ